MKGMHILAPQLTCYYGPIHETKTQTNLVLIGPFVREQRASEEAVGTFDVCLARPKVCPTDIVRPHAASTYD